MSNQEKNQVTTTLVSDLESKEFIAAQGTSEEAGGAGGFTVMTRTKEAPRGAKTDDAPETAATAPTSSEETVPSKPIAPNPTEQAPAKPKSQQADKKANVEKKKAEAQQNAEAKKKAEAEEKALAEQKAIEDQIAVDGIVIEINRCLTQAKLYENQAEKFYFEMGKWLCEAKDKVKKLKGVKWLDWLQSNFQDNFDLTDRTAQIRMKTYNAFADNPKALADFGYTKASIIATLALDKREEFLSKQQHEVKEGVFKTVQDMTTRELERVIQESKKSKPRPPQQKVSVEDFSKKLSSLGTQLDDVVSSLSKIDGDAAESCKKLYTELCELLKVNASKLSDQPSEPTPSDVLTVSNETNSSEKIKEAS